MPPSVTLVTGASSGLGLALARELALRGDTVVMLARDAATLQRAAQAVREHARSERIFCWPADVTDAGSINNAVAGIVDMLGAINRLINSAGILREGYFEDMNDGDFRAVLETNLFGTINCIRAALPHLKNSRGQIVNIASMASHTGVFGYTAYCASKHALKGFTEALYHELTPQGVTVQLICPPEFESPMVDALEKTRTPENAAHTLMIPREPIDVIVRDTLSAIDSGRYHAVPGRRARAMAFLLRLLPGLSRQVAQRTIRRARKEKNHQHEHNAKDR